MTTATILQRQKTIGLLTILSGLVAAGSLAASMVSVNFNAEALSNPLLILSIKGTSANAARWSMILDMFGYYLLLLPVIFLLAHWMKKQSPWSGVVSFNGLAYVFTGAIGASVLAIVWPYVMTAYPAASPAEQVLLKSHFQFFNLMVYGGMWNLLEVFFAAVWWIGTGLVFFKKGFRFIGILTLLTGIACLADGCSSVFMKEALHELALNSYLLLAVLWAVNTGIFLLRAPLHFSSTPAEESNEQARTSFKTKKLAGIAEEA